MQTIVRTTGVPARQVTLHMLALGAHALAAGLAAAVVTGLLVMSLATIAP